MLILTNKFHDVRRLNLAGDVLVEFDSIVALRSHPPVLLLYADLDRKVVRKVLSKAAGSEGDVYLFFDSGSRLPWFVRGYASKLDFESLPILERVNRLKPIVEGTLNYVDIVKYALEAPMFELIENCAELGVATKYIFSGSSETMKRRFIMCDLLERYLKSNGEWV